MMQRLAPIFLAHSESRRKPCAANITRREPR
jgi:hypothetical protein